MNTLMVITRITTALNNSCDRIKAQQDYQKAVKIANYAQGLADALMMMDWDNGEDDDLTQLSEWYHIQICEALISAAMECGQDCVVILKLMEKRSLYERG